MLSHDEVASIVAASICHEGRFGSTVTRRGDYTVIGLRTLAVDVSETEWGAVSHEARITTNGVEAFLLECDGIYHLQEFEHLKKEQKKILDCLVKLAVKYLEGDVRPGMLGRSFFGKHRLSMIITLDGEDYLLTEG